MQYHKYGDQQCLDEIVERIHEDCERNCPESISIEPALPWTEKLQAIARLRNFGWDQDYEELDLESLKFCPECALRNDAVEADYKGQPECSSGCQHDITCDPFNNGDHGDNVHCGLKECKICEEHASVR